MPIYEYRCLGCGKEFETLVGGQMSVACPACGSLEVSRHLSVFGLRTASGFAVSGGGGCGCAAGGCGCG